MIKIDNNTYIQYDATMDAAIVFHKDELEIELAEAQKRLAEIPEGPTDSELLEWAKVNYPFMDYSTEKSDLTATIQRNTNLLREM